MADFIRDLSRLDLLSGDPALESFSLPTRVSDFFRYYFGRFVVNLTHAFKPFAASEIERWNKAHTLNAQLLRHQLDSQQHHLVPIPKGMVDSYRQTTIHLVEILKSISFQTLKSDVEVLHQCVKKGTVEGLIPFAFNQAKFGDEQKKIGSLFHTMGLVHRPAKDVLISAPEIIITNTELCQITHRVYQDIIAINEVVGALEKHHNASTWSPEDAVILKAHYLSLGYRLTLFAVIADNLQKVEHQFVHSLDIVTKAN